MWLVLCVACIDLIGQVSLTPLAIILFLDRPTLNLTIIIIILPTGRPKKVLPTARTTKN